MQIPLPSVCASRAACRGKFEANPCMDARLHEPSEVLGHAHGLLQAHDLLLDGVDLFALQLLAGAVALPPVAVVDEPFQRPDASCIRRYGNNTILRFKADFTVLAR